MSKVKKNDWIAINLNMPEDGTLADLAGYGISPENTSIQDEDYYKNIPRVKDNDLFKDKNGKFDESKFHQFYQSALRSFNDYENSDFLDTILNSIESSPYDTFSLGDGRDISQNTAIIYNSRDPYRTTTGLGNIFEVGNPVFDIREVAQANKARDEKGNILDWSPNDKGFLAGLFRPTMVLATYDEDGYYTENGRDVFHHKGEYKLDERTGDPYYEILGNRDASDKELLHFWDTITRDDSELNKIDFFDSDGLTKSIGGVLTKTALTLLPYFIPNVGPIFGYIGATIALGQALPVLAKSFDAMFTGTDDNGFGQTMSGIENWFRRFDNSQSRDVQGKFWSFENIGDIIGSSAGQLFQQRNIANLSKDLLKNTVSAQKNVKLGQQLSLGYMALTSGEDAYRVAKQSGANDSTAGIMTLGTMAAYYGLFNIDHFKKYLFTNTYMDEDIAMAQTMRELQKREYPEMFAEFNKTYGKKNLTEFQRRAENIKLFKKVKDWTTNQPEKLSDDAARPSIKQTLEANEGKGISWKERMGMYLTRMGNESFEETLEETILDAGKGITLGLQAMGVNVSESDKDVDFGLTWRDAFSRYTSAAIGGAIGGAVFEGFNHWEGGTYDSLLEKSLDERLTWYYRNGYEEEVNKRLELLRKQGKLGNKSLSAKPLITESIDKSGNVIVFGSGDESDNQNEFVYRLIKTRLENLKTLLNEQQLWTSDNELFNQIWQNVHNKSKGSDSDDLSSRLYHFLEDVDKAKTLTIMQKGFLDLVSEDANHLAHNIIEKAKEIEAYKNKLRVDNRINDANKSKEDDVFRNSQKLKNLEEELKDLKEEYDQIAKGERNGYYIGWAFMQSNPKYKSYYTDLNGIENAKLPFPKTEIQNYAKYRTGLEYNDIVDKDLKEKIDSEYNNFKTLQGKEYERALYNMHIKFSEDFASEIMSMNQKYKGWHFENGYNFLLDFYQNEIDSSTDEVEKFLLQSAINKYKANVEEHNKITNVEDKKQKLNADFNQLLFSYFSSGYNEETKAYNDFKVERSISLLTKLLQRAIDTKSSVLLDVNRLRKYIMDNIFTDSFKEDRNKRIAKLYSDSMLYVDSELTNFRNSENITSEQVYNYAKNVLKLTDAELEDAGIESDMDAYDMIDVVFNSFSDKYGINAGGSDLKLLQTKINNLQDAIVNNDRNIDKLFQDLVDFTRTNGLLLDENGNTIDNIEQVLSDAIGPININLVEVTKQIQSLTDQILNSPIVELLKSFDVYSGGKAYNVIQLIESEEAFREAQGLDKYRYRKETIREQLQTALSFLNVVTAVLDSSFDGMNEYINLSQEKQLAVSDVNLKDLYKTNIDVLKTRIDSLIELADKNQKQTIVAQQTTDINTKAERVKTLVGIGKITFKNGESIDFDSIWKNTGYTLNNASVEVEEAVKFNDAYDKFENDVHIRLNSILETYTVSENLNDFVDSILHGFSEEIGLYLQDPGEIGPEPKITPYNNINYLIRLTVQDPNEMKSLWRTSTENNPDLISLFGQESVVSEMIASYEDSINGLKLYNLLHEKIYEELKKHATDKNWSKDHTYTENKTVAVNFLNVDGGAGVGKTGGCDFLALKILELKYDNIKPVAIAPTEDAKNNLILALNSEGNVSNYTVDDIINFLTDDGKIFDFKSAQDEQENPDFVNKDKNGKTIADIPAERIEAVLGKGTNVMFVLDESGMIDKKTMQFLIALAQEHNFFIFASGDRLQNQAIVKKATSGIEDMVYHRLPSLTVSMRAEYNGTAINTDRIREPLRIIQNIEYEVDANDETDYSNKYKDVFKDIPEITLIYSDDNYAGTQKIKSEATDAVIEKILPLIQQLKQANPDKKHQIAIVVDNYSRSKYDKYRENEDFKILTQRDIQGKEFDYVLVDVSQNDNNYFALKNFYTMMTRSKIGSIFVDDKNRLADLKITFERNELAKLPVLGGDAESKRALFKEYIEWKKKLSSKYPIYKRKAENPEENKPKQTSTGGDEGSSGEGVEFKPTDYELYGQEGKTQEELEKLEKLRKDRKERNAYYIQRVLNEEIGTEYDQTRLKQRQSLTRSNSERYIDFDVFIEELRDLTNDKFEELPAALSTSTDSESKKYHRAIIATIARAILNSKPEDRLDYINSAGSVLSKFAGKAGINNKFIIDLQNSFTEAGNGIFMNDNGYMFYGFTSGNSEYLIPIYRSDIYERTYYNKNLAFKTEIGDIKITTAGEMRLSLDEVFTPIDGLLRDDDGNIQIAILTKTEELRNWMKRNIQGRNTGNVGMLFDFFDRSFGKSFIATTGPSPIWRTFKNTFSILRDENKRIKNGVNKVYDIADYAQPFEVMVLQKDISFNDWFEFVEVLNRLTKSGPTTDDANKYKRLNSFFNLEGDNQVEKVFGNRTSSQTINNADKYKELGNYKILQTTSLEGLTSALIRYIQTLPDNALKERFFNNFAKWMGVNSDNDGKRIHHRGFVVRIVTRADNNRKLYHNFRITPLNDKTGFNIEYLSPSGTTTSIYTATDLKITSLFEGLSHNFNRIPENVFKLISPQLESNEDSTSKNILSLISTITNAEDAFSKGQLQVFPVDYYTGTFTEKDGTEVKFLRHYAPFESTIYGWLTLGNDNRTVVTNDIDLKEIDDFLKNDPEFKHGLFAGIKVDYAEDSDKEWKESKDIITSSRANEYSIDITKVIEPLYSITNAVEIGRNSKEFENLEIRFFNKISESRPLEGTDPAIEGKDSTITIQANGEITFGQPVLVNSAWLKSDNFDLHEYIKDGIYELLSFDLLNETFKFKKIDEDIIYDADFIEDSVKQLPTNIQEAYTKRIFNGKNSNGSSVKLQLRSEKTKSVDFIISEDESVLNYTGKILDYNEAGLLLIEDTDGNWHEIQFTNAISEQLGTNRDKYIGYFEDSDQKFAITVNGPIVKYNSHAFGEKPITKRIENLDETYDAAALEKLRNLRKESKRNLTSSVKTDTIGDFNFVFNDNSIPAIELNKYSNTTIPNGNWTLFAYSKDSLYIYNNNDLSTMMEISVNGMDAFLNDIPSDTKLSTVLSNLIGLETSTISQIINASITDNPKQTLEKIIENINTLFEQEFMQLDSDTVELKEISFSNNNFVISTKTDYDIQFKKLIYKALKSEYGEAFTVGNIIDWSNESNDSRKLVVRYQINGQELERTYINDTDGVRRYVAPTQPDSIETIYEDFKKAIYNRKAELESLSNDILDEETTVQLANENNLVSAQIAVLERVDEFVKDIKNRKNWSKDKIKSLTDSINKTFTSPEVKNYIFKLLLSC